MEHLRTTTSYSLMVLPTKLQDFEFSSSNKSIYKPLMLPPHLEIEIWNDVVTHITNSTPINAISAPYNPKIFVAFNEQK